MDADRNIIPIVEDDQGEGFMDELEPLKRRLADRLAELTTEQAESGLQPKWEKEETDD